MKYDQNIIILNALRNYEKTLDRQAARYENHPDIGPIFKAECDDVQTLIAAYKNKAFPQTK